MAKTPENFIRENPGVYWVLAEYPSKSSPGKVHEVRTSQRDGKTYCTCRGWIVALNAGHGICTHIRQYKSRSRAEVVPMDKASFAEFKRGISLGTGTLTSDKESVKRRS